MDQLGIVIITVLFPGIIAATIANKLTAHARWDSFKFSLYSLVFGVLSYSTLQLAVYAGDLVEWARAGALTWTHLVIWKLTRDGANGISPWEIVVAGVLSVPLAFLVSAAVQYKWITRLGTRLRVTSKYGDENLYSYFLNAKEIDWIHVRDREASLTYEGKVLASAENGHIRELVLHDVVVYSYENAQRLYAVPMLYISRPVGQLVIESVHSDRWQGV